jgi:hypothetical protein
MAVMLLVHLPGEALGAESLPVHGSDPGDRAVIPTRDESDSPLVMEVRRPLTRLNAYVEVSTSRATGQDGTLANDFVVDMVTLTESDASPGVYRGDARAVFYGGWSGTPGTYYWQVVAEGFD